MTARTSRRFRRRLSRKARKTRQRRRRSQRGGGAGFQIPYSSLTEKEEKAAVFTDALQVEDNKLDEATE